MIHTQPTDPGEEDDQNQCDGQADDDGYKTSDLLLYQRRFLLDASGHFGDAAHDRPTTGQYHQTDRIAVGDTCTHESDITGFQEVVVSHVDGTFDLVRLSCENGTVEADVSRCLEETHVRGDFIADRNMDNVAGNKVCGWHADLLPVPHNKGFRWEQVEDRVHDMFR